MARGARKPGSRLAGVSEPLVLAEFHLAAGPRVTYVTQAQPRSAFRGLRTDYDRLVLALALAELYAAFTLGGHSHESEFDLLIESLNRIETHEDPLVAALWSFLQALEIEGVLPSFRVCTETGTPNTLTPAWVSPTAGGIIPATSAPSYRDAFTADDLVLVGLERLAEQPEPPSRMRRREESLRVLVPFLRHHAHGDLPALQAAIVSNIS